MFTKMTASFANAAIQPFPIPPLGSGDPTPQNANHPKTCGSVRDQRRRGGEGQQQANAVAALAVAQSGFEKAARSGVSANRYSAAGRRLHVLHEPEGVAAQDLADVGFRVALLAEGFRDLREVGGVLHAVGHVGAVEIGA